MNKIGRTHWTTEDGGLGRYFHSIRSKTSKPLSLQDELELYKRIKKGDREAEHALAKANLRFVISVARNYQNQGIAFDDLVGIGNLGLLRAVRKFDARKNFKFISYAVWWIRQAILQAISEQSRITNVPLNQTTRIRNVRAATERLTQKYHRSPLPEEIAEDIGLTIPEVEEALKMDYSPLSVDHPLKDESHSTLLELLSDGTDPGITAMAYGSEKIITKAFKELPERERSVLFMYFGLNGHASTLEEIGQHLRLTRERVRQLKEKALKSLKKNKLLRDITY